MKALQEGLLTEQDLDVALTRTLAVRFQTGQFDPPEQLPWGHLGPEVINSKEHKELARRAAQKGGRRLIVWREEGVEQHMWRGFQVGFEAAL